MSKWSHSAHRFYGSTEDSALSLVYEPHSMEDWSASKKQIRAYAQLRNVLPLVQKRYWALVKKGLSSRDSWDKIASELGFKGAYAPDVDYVLPEEYRSYLMSLQEFSRPKTSLSVFEGRERSASVDDILWVAAHKGFDVKPEDAPSAIAWDLLWWARDNEKEFMVNMYMKAISMRDAKDKGDKSKREDGRPNEELFALVEKALSGEEA